MIRSGSWCNDYWNLYNCSTFNCVLNSLQPYLQEYKCSIALSIVFYPLIYSHSLADLQTFPKFTNIAHFMLLTKILSAMKYMSFYDLYFLFWIELWSFKRYVHQETVNVTLLIKMVFAGVTKLRYLRWDHPRFWVSPKANDRCP